MARAVILAWVLMFLVFPVAAAPSHATGLNECARLAVETLAKQKNLAATALPGANGATRFYRHGDTFEILQTSGGPELDTIAQNCLAEYYKAHPDQHTTSRFWTDWEVVLGNSNAGYTDAPSSKGQPHICPTDYPPAAVGQQRSGTTVLLFTVTASGAVRDVNVAASSGYLDLDAESVLCAEKWLYNPALSNGVPVDTSWTATVSWSVSGGIGAPAPQLLGSNQNCVTAHVDAAERTQNLKNAVTVISYQLADGQITAPTLSGGSGSNTLDAYAYACVRTWRFARHFLNSDALAQGTFKALIVWKLQRRGTSETPAR